MARRTCDISQQVKVVFLDDFARDVKPEAVGPCSVNDIIRFDKFEDYSMINPINIICFQTAENGKHLYYYEKYKHHCPYFYNTNERRFKLIIVDEITIIPFTHSTAHLACRPIWS